MAKNCESCGMPIDSGKYCAYCTDSNGNLKSKEEIKCGWTNFVIKSEGLSCEEAQKKVESAMKKLPAWKK